MRYRRGRWGTSFIADAEKWTTTTAPVEAAIREQIARDIEALADTDGEWIGPTDPDAILRRAARIARGAA